MTVVGGFDSEFLRVLLMARQRIRRFVRERNKAGTERGGIDGAEAAVDITTAIDMDALVRRDRMQRNRAEVPLQTQVRTVCLQPLLVLAVQIHGVGPETGREVVGARLKDVGAEQARGAIQSAPVHIQQRLEVIAGLEQQLDSSGAIVVTLVLALLAGEAVVHPIIAMLVQAREA